MAHGTGSTMDIYFVMVEVKIAHGGHGDNGKGLVDFIKIHIRIRPANFVIEFIDGTDRGGREPFRGLSVSAVADDFGNRGQAAFFCL